MIAIVNVSPEVRPFGVHTYELRINQKVIATFEHKREDTLATCLRKAAAAADKALWKDLAELVDMAGQTGQDGTKRDKCPPETGRDGTHSYRSVPAVPVTPHFACPVCGFVSYHPKDIENRYCGHCHRFMDEA